MNKKKSDRTLTQRQELAVRKLGEGKGLTAAARAVGVSRQTLYRWLSEPGFLAAMNRWREAVVTTAQGQVLAGLADAAATVVKAAREGNARIAMTLLEKACVFDPLARQLTDSQSVARELTLVARAERASLDSAELDLVDTELHNMLRRVPTGPRPIIRLPDDPPATPSPEPPSANPPQPAAPTAAPAPAPPVSPAPTANADKASGDPSEPPPPTAPSEKSASKSPHSPPPFTYRPANSKKFYRRPRPVSDKEYAKIMAAAEAVRAKGIAFLAEQRKAELLAEQREAESKKSPPPSHPSHSSHSSHPPRPSHRSSGPGMPEPIDDLDDQFTDIWREDQRG